MNDEGSEAVDYTVEREFEAKITAEELISRIILSHVKNNAEAENIRI